MKQEVYAVAVERFNRRNGKWSPDIIYLKADSTGHARNQFCIAEPNRRLSRIVAVGKAIGFFCDENGESISADA